MRRFVAIASVVGAGLMLCSCAGHHKPPSSAKMDAATRRLSTAIDKATATESRAHAEVDAARKAANEESVASANVLSQMNELISLLPPELKPRGEALKKAVEEDQVLIGNIVTHVDGAQREHETLTKDIAEVKDAKVNLETEQGKYKVEVAVVTANWNTTEKQLAKQSWWDRLWKLGAGLLVVLVGLFFLLKALGKLGWALGKIGVKAAI